MHSSSMKPDMSARITEAAKKMSHSISNGSTMKLSPTAVYCAFLPIEADLKRVVTIETNHMHHNPNVVDTNIAMALAVRELVRSRDGYSAAKTYAMGSSIKNWWTEMEEGRM